MKGPVNLYYYFIATLPTLLPRQTPSLSYEEFMQTAERLVEGQDLAILTAARLDNFTFDPAANEVFTTFQTWEINLRNRLAALRAAARKNTERNYEREAPSVPETAATARAAFEAADPLQGESVQNRARWDLLSALETYHEFDIEFLVIYALKLQLLERSAAMSPSAGAAAHQALEEDMDRELLEKMVEAEGGIKET
jgi:hypothetical protein